MNIFITGGTGYLGSTLISRLIGEKEVSKIIALVRNPQKARDLAITIGIHKKLEFVYGDLMFHNYDFSNIDLVIHLAWLHDPDMCENNSGAVFDANIGGIQRIVKALWEFKVPYFIFTSQRTVYGRQETKPLHEDLEPKPSITKGLVTYAGEVITRTLADCPTKFAILRLTHIYGIGTLSNLKKIENDITDKFASSSCIGGNLTIYGNGNQRTHLVHVRDVCDCIYQLITSSEEVWNETYNVAGARDISINELAETYIKVALEMGLKAPVKTYVETEHYLDRAGLVSIWLDISKVQKKLGWTPSVSIEEGVKELITANLDRQSFETA